MIDCLLRKASPLLSMAEQSDAFKQLDAVGKSRYNEKLAMLGITTDPYMTPKDAWDYNPSRWPDEHNKCNALRVHDIRRRVYEGFKT